jgi:DeoR/GlpR family transcriptional regulator of sugar metabolism
VTGGKLKIDIRRKRILEQLRLEGKVSVTQLSESLAVTPVTIRNDLAAMEQEGQLVRIQGGAIPVAGTDRYQASQPADARAREKRLIAQTAAKLVRDGDTLFINSGNTMTFMAEALSIRRNLNVVTNSLAVARKLGAVASIRVVLIGGEINARYGFTHGGDAQEQLMRYQADWAILSVDGISAAGGITTYHGEEAVIDRMMIRGAKRTVIVADSSKIGNAGFSRVSECGPNMCLVTDGGDGDALAELAVMGVQITHPAY